MANTMAHTGTAVDLTSISTNVNAAPEATARLGGFTLRNRFLGSLWSPIANSMVSTNSVADVPAYVLNVPERTMVNKINVFAVHGETAPDMSWSTTASSVSDSDHALNITFVGIPVNKIASSSGVTTKTYSSISGSLTMGQILLTAAASASSKINGSITGSVLTAINARSTATAGIAHGLWAGLGLGAANVIDSGTYSYPRYFHNGGRVAMVLAGTVTNSDASVNAMSASGVGMWEVQAECTYVPE